MKKEKTVSDEDQDTMRPHYDFDELGPGVRGKYYERYKAGTNIALLAPDVRKAFPTDEAVNEALRSVMTAKGLAH
jgi:hypothetical protein